ncbi:hypothetical protein WA171_000154 [Blastocystis sp. BT1]
MSVSRVYADVVSNMPEGYANYDTVEFGWLSPDRYQIIQKVGRGKYSEVFKAIDMTTGKPVSIKYLKPVRKKKIRREIKIMQQLAGGPCIIPLLGVVLNPETHAPSLITKWVETRDFREFYLHLSDYELRYYFYKILAGLDYAHSRGIMHRDIKPQNVLIDYITREVYIIDWGLADYYKPHEKYNVRVSTRHYKGPELLTNDTEYDYSLDIWSLSCMLLGIVFNRTPFFRGKDNYDQLRKIAEIMGSEELDKYIAKYKLRLDKETIRLLGRYQRRSWSEFVCDSTKKFICDELFDYLDKTLVYDHNDRLTAKEAMAHKYFDPVREDVEKELAQHRQGTETVSVSNLLFMEEGKDPEPIAAPVKPVSAWDKFVSTTLKSIRISYMNWTYLPRSTGEQETWQQRLLRYSHFPMATQFFAYFAYRAACQNLYGRFFLYSTGIQYFLQDLNYTHSPMYRVQNPEKQMLMQLGEAVVLGALSTAIATRIHKVPHRSFMYYFISTSTVMVPSMLGVVWSRRKHLTEGNMTFSQSGVVLGKNQKAGIEGTCLVACSRALMSVANVTVPLQLISLFERNNMVFFTPLKGIIFTELAIIASCLLTPIAMGLISPIGTIEQEVQSPSEDEKKPPETVKEEVFYFRGY